MAKKEVVVDDKLLCSCCGKRSKPSDHYMSHSILNKFTNRLPVCKDCIVKAYDYFFAINKNEIKSIYELCLRLDICFSNAVCDIAKNQSETKGSSTVKIYFQKLNSMPQYSGRTFKDSDRFEEQKNDKVSYVESNSILITDSLIEKWGKTYDEYEIRKLEKFYTDMTDIHDINTPQHKQLLKFMCQLNLKMEFCLENDNLSDFSKLHEQYQKILQSSGFRPIDKSSIDNSSGIKTFSQIFESVERDGFIVPNGIEESQDIVDRTIQYILNYTRKLVGVQKLDKSPIDTPKIDDTSDNNDVHVDLTKETEESSED